MARSGRGKKKGASITYQIDKILNQKFKEGVGKSRHKVKAENGGKSPYIHSYSTLKSYHEKAQDFGAWCRVKYSSTDLFGNCKKLIPQYFDYLLKEKKYSLYSFKLVVSALAKLYDIEGPELMNRYWQKYYSKMSRDKFYEAFRRERKKIKRTRNAPSRSMDKYSDIILFCEATGLRRTELENLICSRVVQTDSGVEIHLPSLHDSRAKNEPDAHTKGGLGRTIHVIPGLQNEVLRIARDAEAKRGPLGKVFENVDSHIPVHFYRARFAESVYKRYARKDISEFKHERLIVEKGTNRILMVYDDWVGRPRTIDKKRERDVPSMYITRGLEDDDGESKVFDRLALYKTSMELGHRREFVAPGHYLYGLKK